MGCNNAAEKFRNKATWYTTFDEFWYIWRELIRRSQRGYIRRAVLAQLNMTGYIQRGVLTHHGVTDAGHNNVGDKFWQILFLPTLINCAFQRLSFLNVRPKPRLQLPSLARSYHFLWVFHLAFLKCYHFPQLSRVCLEATGNKTGSHISMTYRLYLITAEGSQPESFFILIIL